MICLDIAVGQPDVFGQGNDFDQMLKFLTLKCYTKVVTEVANEI